MEQGTKTVWNVDAGHSNVQFRVRHVLIAHISGCFTSFSGNLQTQNDDFDGAEIAFDIAAGSIDTNNTVRDTNLRSDIFFDAEQFPTIAFGGLLQKKGGAYEVVGDLTIRGLAKNVKMEAAITGTGKGFAGDTRAGFELNGKINRKDFGLHWDMVLEAGGLVIGEDIILRMDVELIKAP